MTLGCITVVIPAAYQGANRVGALFEGGHEALKIFDVAEDTQDGLLFISRGTSIILLIIYAIYLIFQLKTHSFMFEAQDEEEEEEEVPQMSPVAAILGLLLVTVVTSFSADYLVGSIDVVARDYGIPKAFIGTILLPIVGNAAEHVTS